MCVSEEREEREGREAYELIGRPNLSFFANPKCSPRLCLGTGFLVLMGVLSTIQDKHT